MFNNRHCLQSTGLLLVQLPVTPNVGQTTLDQYRGAMSEFAISSLGCPIALQIITLVTVTSMIN